MKIMRMSGLPVQLESLEQYKLEWTSGFDAAKDAHKDQLDLQKALQELEDSLLRKYGVVGDVKMPRSAISWKALLTEFGAPVMVAQSSENPEELVLVLVDQPMG